MSARRLMLAALVVLGALGALFWLTRPGPEALAVAPGVQGASPTGSTAPLRRALRPEEKDEAGTAQAVNPPRLQLVRPPPEAFDAGLKVIAQRTPNKGPIDRRENPGPHAQQEMEMVRYAFETMDEDIRACLEQWEAVQPGQAGEVMIGFEIDGNGLQRSWLEHDAGVPFGPRTCLANAVYGIDWSHIVDHPAMLTNRFELGRDDGG